MPILADDDHAVIKEIVKNKNYLTLPEIAQRIADRLGKYISQATVHRVIKKLTRAERKRHAKLLSVTALTLKKRFEYINALEDGLASGDISVEGLVFLADAGAKLGMSFDYARAEGGELAVAKEPKQQGKNISMVGAIGVHGVVAITYCLCAVNAMGFANFIDNYRVPNLRPGQTVVMGNVNFHKAAHVESAIKAAKASVMFLPTYSPELNPIEQLGSKEKTFLKSKTPKYLEDFHNKFGEALSTVTASGCEGWFEHSEIIQYYSISLYGIGCSFCHTIFETATTKEGRLTSREVKLQFPLTSTTIRSLFRSL